MLIQISPIVGSHSKQLVSELCDVGWRCEALLGVGAEQEGKQIDC